MSGTENCSKKRTAVEKACHKSGRMASIHEQVPRGQLPHNSKERLGRRTGQRLLVSQSRKALLHEQEQGAVTRIMKQLLHKRSFK